MRKISKIRKWFFRSFLLVSAFTASLIFIFLFRPEYFIDDIKTFIEERLPPYIADDFNIGTLDGNFITGFRVNEVSYYADSAIVFSAQEIYIDPDLSQIILGTISLSEVLIKNSYYNHDHSFFTKQQLNVTKRNILS